MFNLVRAFLGANNSTPAAEHLPTIPRISDYFGVKLAPLAPGSRYFQAQTDDQFRDVQSSCRLAPFSEALLSGVPSSLAMNGRQVCSGFVHSGTGAVVFGPLRSNSLASDLAQVTPQLVASDWAFLDSFLTDLGNPNSKPSSANYLFPCLKFGGPGLAMGLFRDWLSLSSALSASRHELRFEGSAFCIQRLSELQHTAPLADKKHPDHFNRVIELANFISSAYFGSTIVDPMPHVCSEAASQLVNEVISRAPTGAVISVGPEGMLRVRTGYLSRGSSFTVEKLARSGDGRFEYNLYRGIPADRSRIEISDTGLASINNQSVDIKRLPAWEDPIIGMRARTMGFYLARGGCADVNFGDSCKTISRFPILVEPDLHSRHGYILINGDKGHDRVICHTESGPSDCKTGKPIRLVSEQVFETRAPGNMYLPAHTVKFTLP